MSNIPQLRFKGFDDEWLEKSYGDIYNFYSTNSLSRENLNYENGEVYNIHYGDIHTKFSTIFDIEKEEVPYINKDIDLSRIKDENYCQVGDLVIADASEDYKDIGKTIEIVNLNSKKLLAGLHTFLARPEKCDMAIGFMGYMLQSWKARKQIMREAQGTKVLGLSTRRLSRVNLYVPSDKKEQEKIAFFLNNINKKIEQLSKIDKLLNEYKKGVIQKIFNQEIKFKKDDGSDFSDWEEKSLGKIGKPFNGLSGKIKDDFGNGDSYIQYKQIFDNKINISDFGKVQIKDGEKQNIVKYGDILFTISSETRNEVGVSSVLLVDIENVYLNSFCFGFRPNSLEDLLPQFARYLFRSEGFRKKVVRLGQGTTRYNLSKNEIMKVTINLPEPLEQSKIAKFLSSIDKKIEENKNILEHAKEFKKGLLQRMFV